jgi:hypothetical protein
MSFWKLYLSNKTVLYDVRQNGCKNSVEQKLNRTKSFFGLSSINFKFDSTYFLSMADFFDVPKKFVN